MIKVIELFAGIGSQTQALKNIGVEHEVIGISEIDKEAMLSYAAIHCDILEKIKTYEFPSNEIMAQYLTDKNISFDFNKNKKFNWFKGIIGKYLGKEKPNIKQLKKYYLSCILTNNFGDITKIEKLPYCDLLTYSFPCQDISVAGKQEGIKEGTRSGLLYEVERLLEVSEKPKYLLLENVKNLVGKGHKADFDKWLLKLEEMGYKNYWQVLNAKNYGIPQNRERVFVVSVRKDLNKGFDFPIAFTDGEIITYNLQKQVRKRKNTCDIEELKKLLKESKEKTGLTINEITETVGEKKTLVEHWFRSDNCFSIPETENWFKLKEILNIKTNEFDNFITEFEVLDGVYEKANRIYGLEGICPTLTTVGVPEIVEYSFPQGFDNGLRLKDFLEYEVDEKYYISQEKTEKLLLSLKDKNSLLLDMCQAKREGKPREYNDFSPTLSARDYKEPRLINLTPIRIGNIYGEQFGTSFAGNVWDKEAISPTLMTMQGGNRQPMVMIKEATKQGYAIAEVGDSINIEHPNSKARRGRVGKEVAQTLTTSPQQVTLDLDYKIRKLTPKECWRLMGFKDEQFKKAQAVNSDSQLYKQAGNSIVVNVLEEIFKKLFI